MGLQNFIQPGYYSTISYVSIDLDNEIIKFVLKTLDEKFGDEVISPITFYINKDDEIEKYYEENPPVLPEEPEYPEICSFREEQIPMWTYETPAEKEPYYTAKQQYEAAMETYGQAVEIAEEEAREVAEAENSYTEFFNRDKIFENSNLVKQAYLYLISKDTFSGVTDDEE